MPSSVVSMAKPPVVEPEAVTDAGKPDSAAPSGKMAKTGRNALYAIVWRWHFYAGLITAPILLFIIATGTIYVFRTELSLWRDQRLEYVTPQATRLGYEELKRKAATILAGEVEAMVVHPEADRSVRFVGHPKEDDDDHTGPHAERHHSVFLNPYTGEILGQRIEEEEFFTMVLELHRSLMLGTTGRIVTELVTSWGVLLMATGIYLWWPRSKKNVGVWRPRLRGKLYAVLRDWHAVGGAYLVPLGGLLMVTGLFFTLVWGDKYFNNTVKQAGHWAPAWFGDYPVIPPSKEAPKASLDEVVTTLIQNSRPHDNIMMRFKTKPGTANKIFLMQDENKNSYRMVAINPFTAEAVAVIDGVDLPFLYRVRLWAVSIHMGQIFGVTTKILAFVTSLGLLLLGITGLWMWWERRPHGRSGFPRRPLARSLPWWGWGLIGACAAMLPVAGISMLVVMGLDLMINRLRHPTA